MYMGLALDTRSNEVVYFLELREEKWTIETCSGKEEVPAGNVEHYRQINSNEARTIEKELRRKATWLERTIDKYCDPFSSEINMGEVARQIGTLKLPPR